MSPLLRVMSSESAPKPSVEERIAAKRAARRSRLARRIWDLRRQAAAAQVERPAG